ncbi:related to cystinosin [Melanopsichium pennsylvanicum]|uniref:Related to cystinosin n=1 Tax=Melanopsichium pennsylvanicum TaxID=63383 RepID=A0AAJ4XR26_9BASI|nr:related to cystinosin [Melanopsichium pennsylvanicum]
MGVITRSRILFIGAAANLTYSDQSSLALTALSRLLGWIYTLAWSASFYPQIIQNQLNHSTIGLSSDFVALNAVGHTSYLVYNTLLLFYEPVRRAYRKRHGGFENLVQFNDWMFSLHATLVALITLGQFLIYRQPWQKISKTVQLWLAAVLTMTVFISGAKTLKLVGWLDIVNACSTLKLIITLTKYLPQIHLNRKRKSTKGFSIENILLDLIGGLLSLLQLILDAVWIQGSWNNVIGDWPKLGLGLLSIGFDSLLIWQHYISFGPVHVQNLPSLQQHQQEQHQHQQSNSTNYRSTTSNHASPSPSASTSAQTEPNESTSLLR